LLIGLGAYVHGEAGEHLETVRAAEVRFTGIGAAALSAWCKCVEAALTSRSGIEVRQAALRAESAAISARLSGPLSLVYRALAVAEPERSLQHTEMAERVEDESGWHSKPVDGRTARVPTRLSICCFGEFRIVAAGRVADLTSIRPRARQLLRLLAINFPHPLHREVIGGALWPNSSETSVLHSLQVTVSSIRKLFQELLGAKGTAVVAREGQSYRLQLPPGCEIDVERFAALQRHGKQARSVGRNREATEAFASAFDLYTGDLLAEEGVADRERCRSQAVELAHDLAGSYLAAGRPADAAEVCERAVRIDRYADALWRTLLTAQRQAGNRAAEARARGAYSDVLAELGLGEPAAI
jgi:DNA-binding SARP family transcriptional activator